MSNSTILLPVPVLEFPHWRVNLRPEAYQEDFIPNLGQCLEIIEKNKVSLRGWDYPHLSVRDTERSYGETWLASWASFMGHFEYWRLYQSGQFVHLFSIREATVEDWKQKLRSDMKVHLSHRPEIDWEKVPGFISFVNLLYTATEIFEFAARLCQSGVYSGVVNVRIELKSIRGFVLSADWNRSWSDYYAAAENNLSHNWSVDSKDLVAKSTEYSLSATTWFLERFGWLSPTLDVLRHDQENFLNGRI